MSSDLKPLYFSPTFPSPSRSLLERAEANPRPFLSEVQSKTDQLVGGFLTQVCDYKTLGAMVGAGAAYRFARMGILGSASPFLARSGAFLPTLIRAGSYAPALATESAVFTTLQHAFSPGSTFRNFGRDWALAAISLGSLKSFGVLGQNQNGILQHLLASSGLVAGHQAAYRAGLTAKPQGDLLTQFAEAETTNLHLLGGMALAHGLLPGLAGMERSADLRLQGLEGKILLPQASSPLFPRLAYAEGQAEGPSQKARAENPILGPQNLMMSNHSESGGGLDISRLKDLAAQGDQAAVHQLVKARGSDPEAAKALEEAIAVRREQKRARSTKPDVTPESPAISLHSQGQPFSFRKLFSFLNRHRVKDGYGLIELAQSGSASPHVRKSAQHIQSQFSQEDKYIIFTMLEGISSIENSLALRCSHLNPLEVKSLAEDHLAILTADALALRGKRLAREALEEYDLGNVASLAAKEPHAVGLLRVLAKYKNGAAQLILQNLQTDGLLELALRGNPQALSALAYLANLNNPRARLALTNPTMIRFLQNRE